MTKLENIIKGTYLNGVIPNQMVEVIDADWYGSNVIEITFKDSYGNPNNEILYRDNEPNLEIVTASFFGGEVAKVIAVKDLLIKTVHRKTITLE